MSDDLEIEDAEIVEDDEDVKPAPLPAHRQQAATAPFRVPEFASPADYLEWRADQLNEAMSRILKPDVHYGVIPGTGKKPTLLKPGAEFLIKMFDLSFRPKIVEPLTTVDLQAGFVNVVIEGQVFDRDGQLQDSAVASASSQEARWQRAHCPTCGDGVWDNRRKKQEGKFLDSPDFACKDKTGCGWGGDQPAQGFSPDLVNTVFKMAEKRAKVAVALQATGASSFFTQDMEDVAQRSGGQASGGGGSATAASPPPSGDPTAYQIDTLAREDDGSWPKVCPVCLSPDVRRETITVKKGTPDERAADMWKCKNQACQGGQPKRQGDGRWPWASFHDDPWQPGGEIDDYLDSTAPQKVEPSDDSESLSEYIGLAVQQFDQWTVEQRREAWVEASRAVLGGKPKDRDEVAEVIKAMADRYYEKFPDTAPF